MPTTVTPDVRLLDCTLRDGGHVNDFQFGDVAIRGIIAGLAASRVDLVELGFLKDGAHRAGQTLFNRVSEAERYLEAGPGHPAYSLMIRPHWYDLGQLEPRAGLVSTLRFAFHREDLDLTLRQAEVARAMGYEVFLNPVNVPSYGARELEALLAVLDRFHPTAVCMVDTFGSMLPDDLARLFTAFDGILGKEIALGLHLHENLSLSLALALDFLRRMDGSRRGVIDSAVLGMGRIPGNLCTELIMGVLNRQAGTAYRVEAIHRIISDFIEGIRRERTWGYLPAYAITALNHTHRSYAEYLLDAGDLSLADIEAILARIQAPRDREHFNEALVAALSEEHRRSRGA